MLQLCVVFDCKNEFIALWFLSLAEMMMRKEPTVQTSFYLSGYHVLCSCVMFVLAVERQTTLPWRARQHGGTQSWWKTTKTSHASPALCSWILDLCPWSRTHRCGSLRKEVTCSSSHSPTQYSMLPLLLSSLLGNMLDAKRNLLGQLKITWLNSFFLF